MRERERERESVREGDAVRIEFKTTQHSFLFSFSFAPLKTLYKKKVVFSEGEMTVATLHRSFPPSRFAHHSFIHSVSHGITHSLAGSTWGWQTLHFATKQQLNICKLPSKTEA